MMVLCITVSVTCGEHMLSYMRIFRQIILYQCWLLCLVFVVFNPCHLAARLDHSCLDLGENAEDVVVLEGLTGLLSALTLILITDHEIVFLHRSKKLITKWTHCSKYGLTIHYPDARQKNSGGDSTPDSLCSLYHPEVRRNTWDWYHSGVRAFLRDPTTN